MSVFVCVRACARACVCVRVRACVRVCASVCECERVWLCECCIAAFAVVGVYVWGGAGGQIRGAVDIDG